MQTVPGWIAEESRQEGKRSRQVGLEEIGYMEHMNAMMSIWMQRWNWVITVIQVLCTSE